MPVDLSSIQLSQDTIKALETQIAQFSQYIHFPGSVQQLSNLSSNAGLIQAGEIRLGNGVLPGSGFSGLRLGYPGFSYDAVTWQLVGLSNDTLQVGIRSSDGKLLAGAGKVLLDVDGIEFDISDNPAAFTTTRTIQWIDGVNAIVELTGYQDLQPGLRILVNDNDISGLGAGDIQFLVNSDDNATGAGLEINAGTASGTVILNLGSGSGLGAWMTWRTGTPNIQVYQPLQFDDYYDIKEISAPGTPSTGYGRIYAKTDSLPYYKDDSGTEHALVSTAGEETKLPDLLDGRNFPAPGFLYHLQDLSDDSYANNTLSTLGTPVVGDQLYLTYTEFDGTNEARYFGDDVTHRIDADSIIFGWAYFDTTASAEEGIVCKWDATGATSLKGWKVYRDASGNIVGLITDSGGTDYTVTSTTTVASGNWVWFCFRVDLSTELSLWIAYNDGDISEEATNTTSIPAAVNNGGTMTIGGQAAGAGLVNDMDGRVAKVGMSKLLWSDARIQALYAQQRALIFE